MTPSTKKLEEAFPGKGKELRELLLGKTNPRKYSDVQKWLNVCYSTPMDIELVMCAVNQVVDGHGVEAIFGDRIKWPDMEYVNTGDSYNVTVIFDYLADRFRVECVGDWVERAERHGRIYA